MATATQNITNSQSITITLASLASAANVDSSAIDNSTNKFFSVNIQVSIRSNVTTSATGYINIWLKRSSDGGTTYDSQGVLIGVIPLSSVLNSVTTTMSFPTEPFGPLGSHWKLNVENRCGQALNASSNAAQFSGYKADIT